MGSLELPSSGLIYIDSSALIYSVERVQPFQELLAPMWEQVEGGSLSVMSSPIIVIETLMKPIRDGNREIEAQYSELFESDWLTMADVSYSTVETAAHIRAATGLKTPDALHAATSLLANCAMFITNDTDFRRVQDLPVFVLDDFIEERSAN